MKLSLATKIFLGFTVLLGTFALFAFLSVREIRAVADDLRTIRDGHLALARHAAQLETHQQNRFRDLKRGLTETDPRSQEIVLRIAIAYFPDVIRSTVEDARGVSQQQIANAKLLQSTDTDTRVAFYRGIMQRIDRIAEHHESLDELTRTAVQRVRANEAIDDMKEKLDAIEVQLRSEAYQLNKYINDET